MQRAESPETVDITDPSLVLDTLAVSPDSIRWANASECLREDYVRLSQAFRESVAVERNTAAQLLALQVAPLTSPSSAPASRNHETERLRREVATLLASPTWKAGRLITALPRWIRDRRLAR